MPWPPVMTVYSMGTGQVGVTLSQDDTAITTLNHSGTCLKQGGIKCMLDRFN